MTANQTVRRPAQENRAVPLILQLELSRRAMVNKLLGGFLLIVSAYIGWWAVSSTARLWLLLALVVFLCAVGLLMQKRWAQFLWHGIAIASCVWWLISVVPIAASGWPHATLSHSFISLLPGFMLLAVCIAGSVAIERHHRGASSAL